MDKKWNKYLNLLGLAESEINIYLTTLKLGPQPVQTIAKETRLSRVTVYHAIESLTKLGLMTSVEKGKKQVYAAEPPERIVHLAEAKLNNLKSTISEIRDNIEELKLIQSGDKPVVKLFEGPEAIGAIQTDVLSRNIDELCEFGNRDEIDRVYPYGEGIREEYLQKLSKSKMKRRLVFISKNKQARRAETNKHVKFLDEAQNKFFGDLLFYEDTIWLSSFKGKQITVMIKSKEIKDTLQEAFNLLWKSLPDNI